MKKDAMQSMQIWIGHIEGLAFQMVEAGILVTDQDSILTLTMGLSSSYDAVIINFNSTPANQLTLNNVIVCLLNEELRQSSQADSIAKNAALTATPVKTSACTVKPTPSNTNVTCFFCNGKGHYKSDYPEKAEWEKVKKKKTTEFAGVVDKDSDSDKFSF